MVTNTKDYNLVKRKIESIFNSLQIEFELCEINSSDSSDAEDNTLYYSIQIAPLGKLKPLSSISCVLYFVNSDNSMNLVVGNIYSIDETEDPVPLYETVNLANIFSAYGKFVVLAIEGKLDIIYRSIVKCGENFSDLDCDTLKFQIEFFMCYLENFFNLLKATSKETL